VLKRWCIFVVWCSACTLRQRARCARARYWYAAGCVLLVVHSSFSTRQNSSWFLRPGAWWLIYYERSGYPSSQLRCGSTSFRAVLFVARDASDISPGQALRRRRFVHGKALMDSAGRTAAREAAPKFSPSTGHLPLLMEHETCCPHSTEGGGATPGSLV
jgi:hypothetical protein